MPRLLRRDTVRLFEASANSLHLALVGLGLPRRYEGRETSALHAPEIGLIGAAAEQAMAACIVQVFGPEGMILRSGHFKSGSEILDDFRKLIRLSVPRTAFLAQGLSDLEEHRRRLEEQTKSFRTLISSRAGGLHAGQGPSREVCVVMAKAVADFLATLAASSRIRPYLEHVPAPPEVVKERTLLVEELARAMRATTDIAEKGRLLSSLYLVVPELPQEEPDWIRAFDRVSVAPSEEDVTFLLSTLERALPASLVKVSGGDHAFPVVVRTGDSAALPIAPQYLKREFTQLKDQYYADVGNANGRLSKGQFNPPPIDFVQELFVLGLENVGVIPEGEPLSAHATWPFVASSLSVHGTQGPYWFLVRRTNDLGQLRAQMTRAGTVGSAFLRKNLPELLEGLKAIDTGKPLSTLKSGYAAGVLQGEDLAEQRRVALAGAVARNVGRAKGLNSEATAIVALASDGTMTVGAVLQRLLDNQLGTTELETKRYWARLLCEASSDEADLPAVLSVLRAPEFSTAHTAAKKAMRLIDQLSFGPEIDSAGSR